jgi:hypothetical protein
MARRWNVVLLEEVSEWIATLSRDDQHALVAAMRVLEQQGPALKRPLVGIIEGSRHKGMKELRPGSTGRSEYRLLFIFDPERKAVVLVGGDKAGMWNRWYDKAVKVADDRYDEYLRDREGR